MRNDTPIKRWARAFAGFCRTFANALHVPTVRWIFGAALSVLCAGPTWCAERLDNEVKAAFVIRFTEFIQWPDDADPARPPFGICVLGDHPITRILARLTTGYTVRGRTIDVRPFAQVESARTCHVVFVPDTQSALLPALARALQEHPTLVIGNSPGLADAGAAINLFRDGSRLRFEINPRTLDAAGLRASSQLLKLAVIRGGP